MNYIVFISVILIFAVIGGIVYAINMTNKRTQERRMASIIRGVKASAVEENKGQRNEQDKRRAEIAKKLKEHGAVDGKKDKKATMTALLAQAGLSITIKQYWMFSAGLSLVCVIGALIMGMSGFVVFMMGIIGLFGLPQFIVRRRIKKRQKQFLDEFADALEAMVRLLKAGMPVTEAIAMAGREFAGPVGEEMMRIYEAQKVGIPMPEATLAAARRMPLTEMQMFATGIAIQQQTGASLSEVLLNLAGTIRARYRLKRKIQALSSEAKASAMIIGSLPFLIGGGLFLINPDYMNILFDTTQGRFMLVGGAVWMSLGILSMKIMINFKV